jgi:hypothetical protein
VYRWEIGSLTAPLMDADASRSLGEILSPEGSNHFAPDESPRSGLLSGDCGGLKPLRRFARPNNASIP